MHRATLVAAAAAPPSASGSPRRAADVAVVGGSLQAYAAAYLLAKRGKRTVLVEHAAPQLVAAGGGPRPDVVLHCPAATPHLVNEASEALALWRGIEAASGAKDLLHLCGSIDIAPARGSSAASDALGAMQDASRAAGLQFAMLAGDEVSAAFPRLRPPAGAAALYTNLGGVVQGRVAAAVLRAMAQRAGALVADACLLGWRDAGGHFALRTAAAPAAGAALGAAAAAGGEGETVYECEQLVLLPEAAALRPSLALFGLAVPGAALWRVPVSRCAAQEDCAAVPLWQLLGTGSTRGVDDPTALDSCWGTPVLGWAPGSVLVAQSLADGAPADQPAAAAAASGSSDGSAQQQQQQQQGDPLADLAAAEAAAEMGLAERPGSEEAIDAELARLAEKQQQEAAAQRRLATAGALAGRLVYGVGGRLSGRDGALQLTVTSDGEPGVGSHPGFEAGRVVAGFAAAGAQPGCLPGDQLAPLLGRLAVGALLGQAPEAVSAAAVALEREALAAEAAALAADTWAEMHLLLPPGA